MSAWQGPACPLGGGSSGQCACAAWGGTAAGRWASASCPGGCVPRTECHSPAYILGHLCLAYCPPRYFSHTQQAVTPGPGRSATPTLRICSSCHASCYTCRGGSPLNCTTCPPSYTLDELRGSCSGPVPPNSTPQPTAVAQPSCHRGPAQAVVLALLAMALGSPFLRSVLCGSCLPPCGGLLRAGPPPSPPQGRLLAGT